MYLAKNICWKNDTYEMVGTVPGTVVIGERPQGRGYAILEETGNDLWSATQENSYDPDQSRHHRRHLHAHEFHYARLTLPADDFPFAYKVIRGYGIDGQNDGLVVGHLKANFTHLRNATATPWVSRFVNFVREHSNHGQRSTTGTAGGAT
jgi:cobyrinic acid a,c-diamide synthase